MRGRKAPPRVDLSGTDFWLDAPLLPASIVQTAIAEALATKEPNGPAVIRVGLLFVVDSPHEVVVTVRQVAVGVLSSEDGRFGALAEALAARAFAGSCGALVVEEAGRYRLMLDLDPAYAGARPDAA